MRRLSLILFIIAFIFWSPNVFSQKFSFELGQGSFKMSEMKSFQQGIRGQLNFDARVIENFPSFYTLKMNVLFVDKGDVTFGLTAGSMSTGGRLSYGDFSGSYKADSELSGTFIGIMAEYLFIQRKKFEFGINASPFLNFSALDFSSEFVVLDAREIQSLEFVSTSMGIETGILIRYYVGPLFFQGFMGTNINFGGDLELKSNRDALLVDAQNQTVRTNWSGIRTNLGLGINLRKNKNE